MELEGVIKMIKQIRGKGWISSAVLGTLLVILSCISLFVGVIDVTPQQLLGGDVQALELLLISRLPRLLAILCTGMGMSVAGLIIAGEVIKDLIKDVGHVESEI